MRGGANHRHALAAASAGFALVLVLAILVGVAGPATPSGAASSTHQKLVDGIVRFLQEHQLESGGYADKGRKPSQSISAWVTLALAAAGINPLDQTRTVNGVACGHSAQEYLEGHFVEGFREETAWPEVGTTAFERELLVVDTSGTDPHDFAGDDLVEQIIARQGADGGIPYVPGGEAQVERRGLRDRRPGAGERARRRSGDAQGGGMAARPRTTPTAASTGKARPR